MTEYIEKICCGNCGMEIPIQKEIDTKEDVISFICPNCGDIREERIKE